MHAGTFPEALKKDYSQMNEGKRCMWDHYVEINESRKTYKFLWPGVPVKGNIVFKNELVDSFMTKYFRL